MTTLLEKSFPGLVGTDYEITSPVSLKYNCIAWAMGDDSKWWWPDEDAFWPLDERSTTLESFTQMLHRTGFVIGQLPIRDGFDSIALYVRNGRVTHVARWLRDEYWTSKLGLDVDIRHTLTALQGDVYGSVARVFFRERSG